TFPAVPRNNPMTVDFQTSAYFHPEGDGVLIGMSDRLEAPGYVTDVNWEFLENMLEQAARRAPALANAGIKTAWAGLYDTPPDRSLTTRAMSIRPTAARRSTPPHPIWTAV